MKTIGIFIFILITLIDETTCKDAEPKIKKYCREKSKGEDSNEIPEYLLVDTELNSTVILECKYCKQKTNYSLSKFWHWQDITQTEEEKEVELNMNNNITLNRLHMTAEFSLIIRTFLIEDAGIYRCYGEDDLEREKKYSYRLEPVLKVDTVNSTVNGSKKDWNNYNKTYLAPLILEFSTSTNKEFVVIREEGVILELVSEWGTWSPCENCKRGRGIKTKRAQCRIKCRFDETIEINSESEIVQFFNASSLIPCRSSVLQERFPSVSNATRHLAEFVLTKNCTPCKKKKKNKKKYKYKRRLILQHEGHIAIACPKSTEESNVVWRKDSKLLEKGKGRSFRKKDPEPRVFVDMFFTIYLKDVSEAEQGKYTCDVDDVKMMLVKILVVPKPGALTQAFVKHMGYLSSIFLFTFVAYCTVVIKTCKNRKKFKIQTYEQIMQDENEKLLAKR